MPLAHYPADYEECHNHQVANSMKESHSLRARPSRNGKKINESKYCSNEGAYDSHSHYAVRDISPSSVSGDEKGDIESQRCRENSQGKYYKHWVNGVAEGLGATFHIFLLYFSQPQYHVRKLNCDDGDRTGVQDHHGMQHVNVAGKMHQSRRDFVKIAALGGAILLLSCSKKASLLPDEALEEKDRGEEISPAEDLMREHGVLKRLLLVYRHYIQSFDSGRTLQYQPLAESANLIRTFIEDYHEKLEEEHLFPRFRKAEMLVELVDTLQVQHQRGRVLTERIITMPRQEELRSHLMAFVRMYEPHEAREDTILFPAIPGVVSRKEFRVLGEQFEEQEHRLFGGNGFENVLEQVASIENQLGLYDLSQFSPTVVSPAGANSSGIISHSVRDAAAVIPLLPGRAI